MTGLTATITLPPGVELTGTAIRSGSGFGLGAILAEPFVVSGAWLCLGTTSTVTCTGPDLAAGDSSSAYLGVRAAASAAGTTPVSVTVAAPTFASATVTGTQGVAATGISARWAGRGHLGVTEVGAPLLTCPLVARGCADAKGGHGTADSLDNNSWAMTPLDEDGDPATTNSSGTSLTLDSGSQVVFAGLYWSGNRPANATDETLGSARLTDPTGVSTDIAASRVDRKTISSGDVYQAFADVTDAVSTGGTGRWTLANVTLDPGSSHYGGWSLVVVYGNSSMPDGKVTVFEGFQAVNPGAPVSFTVAGTAGEDARIGLVAWEGDAGINGDRMRLDGVDLSPATGLRDANNIADSTATGASDVNSFGVDAKPLTGGSFNGNQASLVASTSSDVFLVGVVTVSSIG